MRKNRPCRTKARPNRALRRRALPHPTAHNHALLSPTANGALVSFHTDGNYESPSLTLPGLATPDPTRRCRTELKNGESPRQAIPGHALHRRAQPRQASVLPSAFTPTRAVNLLAAPDRAQPRRTPPYLTRPSPGSILRFWNPRTLRQGLHCRRRLDLPDRRLRVLDDRGHHARFVRV